MRLENLKQDFPEMPEELRAMIEGEVQKQIGTVKQTGKKRIIMIKRSLVAAAAAVMLLSTTIFAGVIYQMRSEAVGKYGVNVKGLEATSAEPVQDFASVRMEVSYLPDGMIETEDGKYSYQDALYQGGVSICFYDMDTTDAEFEMLTKNVIKSETIQVGNYDGIYLELQGAEEISFNQRIYVAYPDFHYVMELFAASDVSKQEALKIAEGIRLLPDTSGAEKGLVRAYSWSEYLASQKEDLQEEQIVSDVVWQDASVLKNTHTVGEAFWAYTKEEREHETLGQLKIKVTDVQISDRADLLNPSGLDADLKKELEKELDTEGKLLPAQINYIKYGNGIDTLNTVVDSREVPQKLVYITAEYTNVGEETLPEVLFMGSLVRIQEEGNRIKMYNGEEPKAGDAWDAAQTAGAAHYWEMWYYDVHGGERGNNYITDLKPSETKTVHMAWIVPEEELEYLYLSFDTYGCYEFSERALEIGYVDIRK